MEKGHTTPLLDHGYVKLIDWMGEDETIVEAARMSTGKGFISWDAYERCDACGLTYLRPEDKPKGPVDVICSNHKLVVKQDGDQGFLEFLLENNHTTPFEMCELAIEVQAPIFVFREWHRHRTQSYNEFSARYSVMPNIHYVPSKERMVAVATANKQAASVGEKEYEDLDEALHTILEDQAQIYQNYEVMLEHGVPKEIARINTPVARYSKMRAKTDLWNWLKFLKLRMAPNAMWEIRQYANAVAEMVEECFPRTYALFEEYSLHGTGISRTEILVLKEFFQKGGGTSEQLYEIATKHLPPKRVKKLLDKVR